MATRTLSGLTGRVRSAHTPRPHGGVLWAHFVRRLRLGALLWSLVCAVTVASSAVVYADTFTTRAERQALASATATDRGLGILMGPVADIGSVGGYTVYKCFLALVTIAALWGLLGATRLLRGDEDTGRWQLLLAGALTPGRAVATALGALAAGAGALLLGSVAGVVAADLAPRVDLALGSALVYGSSIAMPAIVFAAVGTLASQLVGSRRAANSLGLAALAGALVLRMFADAKSSLHWLLWTTPYGWSELMRPFTRDDLRPLVLGAVATGVLLGSAAALGRRRDMGSAVLVLPERSVLLRPGLGSVHGLSLRLELPVLGAWLLGGACTGLALGSLTNLATGALPSSLARLLTRFGAPGSLTDQFLAVAFLLAGALIALMSASQLHAAAEEQESGRLRLLLAHSSTGSRWLALRVAVAAMAMVLFAVVLSTTIWLTSAVEGHGVRIGALLTAGLALLPPALLVLGLGTVVFAVAARAAAGSVYVVVAASFICEVLGSLDSGLHGLENLSVFALAPRVPAEEFDPLRAAVVSAVAVVLVCMGTALHRHRSHAAG